MRCSKNGRGARRYKSGFVCKDGRRKTVRKPLSGFTQDVFSAEVWLASAPLHEAGKTTKSGDTLKTGIGRGQLSFASDNPSSNPNACPLISTFSKPHSEVASTTTPPRRSAFEKMLSGFLRSSDRKSAQPNPDFYRNLRPSYFIFVLKNRIRAASRSSTDSPFSANSRLSAAAVRNRPSISV